jgi:transcriptional regulator GlxA family with amidase domain
MIRLHNENESCVVDAPAVEILPRRNSSGSPDRKIEESITYMKEHLNGPLAVAVLAAQAKLSLSHYFALFKRRTGCAPMDYFTRLRMRRARFLLETTCLSIKEIAAVLGYDDQFYFSRVFKSVHSVAPSDYRALPEDIRCQLHDRTVESESGSPITESRMVEA